jgi:hypothetical protein
MNWPHTIAGSYFRRGVNQQKTAELSPCSGSTAIPHAHRARVHQCRGRRGRRVPPHEGAQHRRSAHGGHGHSDYGGRSYRGGLGVDRLGGRAVGFGGPARWRLRTYVFVPLPQAVKSTPQISLERGRRSYDRRPRHVGYSAGHGGDQDGDVRASWGSGQPHALRSLVTVMALFEFGSVSDLVNAKVRCPVTPGPDRLPVNLDRPRLVGFERVVWPGGTSPLALISDLWCSL